MNITRCSIISRRRVERDNGERCFFRGLRLRKKNAITQKKRKKHHMPDVCRAYDAYEAYEVWKGLFLTPSTARGAVPLPRRGRSGGGEIESLQNVGGRAMRAPTTLRKAATVRCICNAGLHHCNGWKHLQPSVAPPYTVGARIARPFISDVITTFREGARRVIGATAKPLYAIDVKAVGLDRRNPRPPSLREGDRRSGGRSSNPLLLRRISFFFRHTPDT